MTKVLITQSKLDDLAETIGAKTGQNIPLTIDQMKNAIYSITIPRGTKSITENGAGIDIAQYANIDVNVQPTLQSKSVTYTPSETAQSAMVTADSGYDGLSSVDVGVGAISPTYVGSGIDQRSSADLRVGGATVTVPAGYYSSQASKAVANGTEGTPVAKKGTANNHTITITPSVANSAGYIIGSEKTGTAVTVSASELVSGTKSITENGTGIDVTEYAAVDVEVPDNTLVVTLSYNDQTEMWEPDCTYAEAYAAYQDGKDIIFVTTEYGESYPPVHGEYRTMFNAFFYEVARPIVVDYDRAGYTTMNHFWDATRVYVGGSADAWYTSDATAQPSQVTEGAVFYNANGKQVGTFDPTPSLQSKLVTPTESAQRIFPDSGYDGLDEVDVAAISSTYVGSGVTRRTSSDLTGSLQTSTYDITAPAGYYDSNGTFSIPRRSASDLITSVSNGYLLLSYDQGYYPGGGKNLAPAKTSTDLTVRGATVTVPAGYYESSAQKSIQSGTEGTPKATKGTVSNNSVSITPSVTNSAGYITGSTKTGTAVTVTASELVSGTYAVNSSGTKDVTNYASASVAAGGATASATKGSVSNHSVTVTPSVTRTAGWVTAGTSNGTAVTISASELVSGTYTVSASGTHDVTNYESASVAEGSATAPSSINGTAATITTGTNTLTLTKTVSVTPSVTAGYISTGTEGNSSISLTASVSTKAAATITPSTTNQTIAAGTYLTGAQTIAGDADLIASNIISTANIFGVQGSVVVQNYYTGTSEPSSSLGINGDLYFQTKE